MTNHLFSRGHQPEHFSGARHPECPKCDRRMAVKSVAPVLFAGNFDDVLYACEICSAEVKRTVKRG